MNLHNLLSQLEELSRQWHGKYDKDALLSPHLVGVGYDSAADELDLLIAKAKEPATDTVP